MKCYNGEKYIVSFTSFGKRVPLIGKTVFSLQKQNYNNFHLVLTLHKNDLQYIDETVQSFIDADLFEVLVAEEELGPHLKYYYSMLKYHNKPIITVDDDRVYHENMIRYLVEAYEVTPYKSVISNRAIKMQRYGGKIIPYPFWTPFGLRPKEKSYIAMAEGFAGILYPPNCFENMNTKEFRNGTLTCKYDDDLYLRVLEIQQKIPVTNSEFIGIKSFVRNVDEQMQYNLHENQNKNNTNRINMCYKFEKELLRGWNLE